MNSEQKIEIMQTELDYIQDDEMREAVSKLVGMLPDYFFEVAASSTGKYHPAYALETGGLVRHTKAAVRVAKELYNAETFTGKYDDLEKDSAIAALILHDGIKHGLKGGKYTVTEHPNLAADFVLENAEAVKLYEEDAKLIADLIRSHMGQWNSDYKTKEELMPKPETSLEKFVHLCDYIASRKCLEVPFTEGNEIGV